MSNSTGNFIPRFAINKPITVMMGLLAILVVGYIAFSQMAVELMPTGFVPPFLGVFVPYPNANPQEVEEQIAKPVEEQVQTISGVRRIHSNSHENGCWIFIEFSQETDMNLAYTQLRDRMDRVKSELPEDVERIFVRKWTDDDEPILWIAFVEKEPVNDPYLLVEQHVQKPLTRIDGVANVEIWGADEKEVLIRINQDLVKTYKINLYEIIQQLRSDNFAISSGFVTEGGHKIYVRSNGKFLNLAEIENLPIRGMNLRLKDIAEVKYDVPERRWRNLLDGKKTIGVGVFKESMANTVQLCQDVLDLFKERIATDPQLRNYRYEVLFNQGELIQESVDNLEMTGLWGGFFAFIVLFFFLRRIRMTTIVTIAIPLSVLISLTILYFVGWSLNLVTMMGLMIAVGMVVDNSIVVLENIYRKRAEGLDTRQAALIGSSEVGLAVTLATMTTVIVFLPLILMNDEIGFKFYMLRIGLPVILSLLASLLVAMIFIPLSATKFVSQKTFKEPKSIDWSNRLYQKILSWTLNHRLETVIFLVLIVFSMFFAASRVKSKPGMQGNISDFQLYFEMPDNYMLNDAQQLFSEVEDTVRTKQNIYGIRTINSRFSNNWGHMRIFLHPSPKEQWFTVVYKGTKKLLGLPTGDPMARDEVIEDLKKRIPKFPGVKIRHGWHQDSSQEDASVSIVLYGDDTNTLAELSKEVERRMNSIEEILSVETDREKGSDEIRLQINRIQAKKYGISPTVIAGTIQYALRGLPLPKFHTSEKEIDVHIQLREEDRQNLHQLKNLTFFTASGKEIPLDALVTFEVQKGFGGITRENGKTFLEIKATTAKDNFKLLFDKVDQAMVGFQMPYGYSWSKGRQFDRMQESGESQQFALILSGTFVFLIMGILFESFVLPLSVIISIPFAFVGAYWLMFLSGTPIDTMSQIGFVILVGVVVNNAIVLIDLINRLRNEGWSRTDAIIEAGKQRFRPILMTAFTTIGGLLPMAVGNAKMIGIPYAPMGRTIIGGLLTSTFLTLLAVPCTYTLLDDMRNYFKRLVTVLFYQKHHSKSDLIPANQKVAPEN
ncbi:efflux RND transporter permease subunit [candidate division KSB1 bacterium]|nr:efflux RND transporter permease subunit [candidate division KSB1 bacterium]